MRGYWSLRLIFTSTSPKALRMHIAFMTYNPDEIKRNDEKIDDDM